MVPAAAVAAAGGGIGGLIAWMRSHMRIKRQEYIFSLMKEFDDSGKMEYAKKILNGVAIPPKDGWKNDLTYYHKSNLINILRDDKNNSISDFGEASIRESFDSLIGFLYKLECLVEEGLIKRKEIRYFQYYVDKVVDEKAVLAYIIRNKVPLQGRLDERLSIDKSPAEPMFVPEKHLDKDQNQ